MSNLIFLKLIFINYFNSIQNKQLSKRYRAISSGGKSPLDELLHAFELAERSSPGVTEIFVRDLLAKMVPTMTESRVRTVVDRMIRFVHYKFNSNSNSKLIHVFCLFSIEILPKIE